MRFAASFFLSLPSPRGVCDRINDMEDPIFNDLKKLFNNRGYRLYIVGGTTRDLLLGRSFSDRDYVSDATPDEMKVFLPDADFTFAKYGAVKLLWDHCPVDITTLREEKGYQDYRHPGKVTFVKDPKLDYLRRDFTINAMYLDEEYSLLDYSGGLADLEAKLIRFIGDPEKRVQEDPLRILRAERFAKSLGFSIEPKTLAALSKYHGLIAKLNPEKIKEEQRKLR
jgi:tRNA nucleotidyltransferase (CCA-adding enzyme)